jgi:large subunit ribosomal protein L18
MSISTTKKHQNAKRRARRTRAQLHGTATLPRLTVKRSLKHIYVQLVNDDVGQTLLAVSDKDIANKGKPLEVAKEVGNLMAKKAVELGIQQAVFDRGAYRYHGRVAAIADGARESGLTV